MENGTKPQVRLAFFMAMHPPLPVREYFENHTAAVAGRLTQWPVVSPAL
jgi:hypothetical protein